METPTACRIVMFVSETGTVVPAIITYVWSETTVNLFVFGDASFGIPAGPRTSVTFSDSHIMGSWHWPERN